jgi:hypothetical protein
MSSFDPNLAIELEDDVAEVGGSFVCHISRSPMDGELNESGRGQVRSIRLVLRSRTEGRGTEDSKNYSSTEIAVDEYGMASGRFELPIPHDAPISYDGELIRVIWEVSAITDIKHGRDQRSTATVLVVPIGGRGRYSSPHPLRVQR